MAPANDSTPVLVTAIGSRLLEIVDLTFPIRPRSHWRTLDRGTREIVLFTLRDIGHGGQSDSQRLMDGGGIGIIAEEVCRLVSMK